MDKSLDGRRGIREYLLGILEDPLIKSQIEKLLADGEPDGEISTAEDELIEQFLDDELSPDDRKHFINHFLAAPQRQQQLRIHQKLRKYAVSQERARVVPEKPSPLGWRQFFSMPALGYALVSVVVLGLGYGVWQIGFNTSSDVETAIAELPLAYKGQRPFNLRIVDFDYAAGGDTRGGDDKKTDSIELKRATRMLEIALADKRTAQSLYGRGKAYLAEGELSKAISHFEEATALGPVSARLMSDLGTAYLEGAAGKTEMLDKSLQSLDRAIELDPKMPEPRFNRALVLEAQGSREQAKQAWREYLQLDPNSKWSEEANRKLRRLEENQ